MGLFEWGKNSAVEAPFRHGQRSSWVPANCWQSLTKRRHIHPRKLNPAVNSHHGRVDLIFSVRRQCSCRESTSLKHGSYPLVLIDAHDSRQWVSPSSCVRPSDGSIHVLLAREAGGCRLFDAHSNVIHRKSPVYRGRGTEWFPCVTLEAQCIAVEGRNFLLL